MIARNTKTKEAVVNFFSKNKTPQTIGSTYASLHQTLPTIAYSTVYRIVKSLVEDKKLITLDWKDRGGRFEWADREHHHHAHCLRCGLVQDLADNELSFSEQDVAQKIGFKIESHTIELKGVCRNCSN